MRLDVLRTQFVENMPKPLEGGVLYVSEKYEVAIHLCPCGCGNQAVTPLGPPHGWVYTREGDVVTLQPSLLNHFACESHYFIVKNRVQWV